jgi:hypothetical protein
VVKNASVTKDLDPLEIDKDLARSNWLGDAAISALSPERDATHESPNDEDGAFTLDKTGKNAAVWIFARPGDRESFGGLVYLWRERRPSSMAKALADAGLASLSEDDSTEQWVVGATGGGTDFSMESWDNRVADLDAWSLAVSFSAFDPSIGAAIAYGRLPQPGTEVEFGFGFGFSERCKSVITDNAGRFILTLDVSQDEARALMSFKEMREGSPHPILRLRTPDGRNF